MATRSIGTTSGTDPIDQVALVTGGAGDTPVAVSDTNPVPVKIVSGGGGGGSSGGLTDAQLRASPVPVTSATPNYTQTVVTLTANQVAGTDPILAANATRRGLQFSADSDFKLSLTANSANGLRVFASARDEFYGNLCPTSALYLTTGNGLTVGTTIVVWEA